LSVIGETLFSGVLLGMTSKTPKSTHHLLLDVNGAAEHLNVTVHFIRRLVRERRVHFHKVGYHVRFYTDDLDAFVEAGRQPALH
jgi:excisionase family DNA binding protein